MDAVLQTAFSNTCWLYFHSNGAEIVSKRPFNDMMSSIGSDNGLVPTRGQVIIPADVY